VSGATRRRALRGYCRDAGLSQSEADIILGRMSSYSIFAMLDNVRANITAYQGVELAKALANYGNQVKRLWLLAELPVVAVSRKSRCLFPHLKAIRGQICTQEAVIWHHFWDHFI